MGAGGPTCHLQPHPQNLVRTTRSLTYRGRHRSRSACRFRDLGKAAPQWRCVRSLRELCCQPSPEVRIPPHLVAQFLKQSGFRTGSLSHLVLVHGNIGTESWPTAISRKIERRQTFERNRKVRDPAGPDSLVVDPAFPCEGGVDGPPPLPPVPRAAAAQQ